MTLDSTQKQKLEILGRLAGGVAHDINNVLASIMGVATAMRTDLQDGKQVTMEDINDIMSACRRGGDLTFSLLGFSRKGDAFKRPMSLIDEVEEARKFLARVVGKNVEIRLEYPDSIPQVEADVSEIKNVIMNLCINGIDAMGGTGVLRIRLSEQKLEGGIEDLPAGKYVMLEVIDTGEGMDSETVKRVFQAFFTTKPEGEGTGLGLSRAWKTIRDHKGTIVVDSKVGQGTTMVVYFPALGVEREDPGIKGSREPVFAGEAKIMIVDDEGLIRKSGKRMLARLGYEVEVFANGYDAIEYVKHNGDSVDLMVLDMIMPNMAGPEVFRKIRAINPDLPVVICSGYAKDHSVKELLENKKVGFVKKPFSLGEMSEQIVAFLGS